MIRRGQLVVLESTTFPGTTREHLVPLLEESGLRRRATTSRSRSRPSASIPAAPTTRSATRRRSSAGSRRRAPSARSSVYGGASATSSCRSPRPRSPSSRKLLENIFRSVNIALVNELAILADRMGIDIWEVVDAAAATKPFGFMRFEPGPGMGGHCLPVDPFYLTWKAREYDLSTEFIELAGKVNQQMPYFCLEKIERALNDAGKPVEGRGILILGVAYKAGVGDMRESPALKIIELLRERGADVAYHDPHVPELPRVRPAQRELGRRRRRDLAVIVTAHPGVDHRAIAERRELTLDLRGVTRGLGARGAPALPVLDRAAAAGSVSLCGPSKPRCRGRRRRWTSAFIQAALASSP